VGEIRSRQECDGLGGIRSRHECEEKGVSYCIRKI